MFDNTKPNIILLSDFGNEIIMPKTLGPYKVAHILRQAGYQVAVLHHLSVFTIDEIKKMLLQLVSNQTLFVGINNFFYSNPKKATVDNVNGLKLSLTEPGSYLPHGREYNNEIKQLVQDLNPKTKFVLGGPSATDAQFNSDFDYILLGYAEISIINLADHLLKNTPLIKHYHSINGFVILDDSKAEGYDFTGCTMEYAEHDCIIPGETLVIEIGRGCIFKCAFCSYPLNGKKKLDFIRNKELIIKEMLDNYNKFGVTRYIFCDDTFNDSVDKCKMIYEISQELPFDLEWWAYIRLDLLAAWPETVDMLLDSGMRSAFFGIETLNERSAKVIGKGGSRQKLISTMNDIKQRHGDNVGLNGSFIFGLPHESIESMQETIDFLVSDENPLDSWTSRVLHIRSDANNTASHGFLSDFDVNWHKYGYKQIDIMDINQRDKVNGHLDTMIWKNEYTDFFKTKDMVKKETAESFSKKKVDGQYAFGILSYNLDKDKFYNKPLNQVHWHDIDIAKMQQALKYKKLLQKHFRFDFLTTEFPGSYSDYVKTVIQGV